MSLCTSKSVRAGAHERATDTEVYGQRIPREEENAVDPCFLQVCETLKDKKVKLLAEIAAVC